MKTLLAILIMMTWGLSSPAMADSSISSGTKFNKSKKGMKIPMYQPRKRGAPSMRVGGGSRGYSDHAPTVYVLAPDHVGLTLKEQPTLSWYISKSISMRCEFTLIEAEGIDPLLELTLNSSKVEAGIHSLNLADHDIKLKPGVRYQWSVALISEEGHRSNDIISSGMIERHDLTESLKTTLNQADAREDVFIYAHEGYWYDAVNEITDLVEKHPGNDALKQQQTALLNQVGLLVE